MKSNYVIYGILIILVIAVIAVVIFNQQETDLRPECCKECIQVHSAVPGLDGENKCIIFKSGYSHLPYKLSDKCINYFENNRITMNECERI